MVKILNSLKDIPGVVGSFVIGDGGSLVCRDMPAVFPDSLFPEVGRRLRGVAEAVETQASGCNEVLLKFESYWLLCRKASKCMLSILSTQTVNYPALRMATSVAIRQIDEQVQNGSLDQAPAPAPAAIPQPVAAQQPASQLHKPPQPTTRRFFRGQPID